MTNSTVLPVVALSAPLPKGFVEYKMEVSVTDTAKKERNAIGYVCIAVPTLSAVEGLTGFVQSVDEKTKALVVDDDGIPVYNSDLHNWLQATIFNQVKNQARNKLQAKSLDIKGNTPIATDWASLSTPSEGGARGFTIMSEVKGLFTAYILTLGKKASTQKSLISFMTSAPSLALQDKSVKAKFSVYVTDFAETLDAEQGAKYENYLQKVIDICDSEEEDLNDF